MPQLQTATLPISSNNICFLKSLSCCEPFTTISVVSGMCDNYYRSVSLSFQAQITFIVPTYLMHSFVSGDSSWSLEQLAATYRSVGCWLCEKNTHLHVML